MVSISVRVTWLVCDGWGKNLTNSVPFCFSHVLFTGADPGFFFRRGCTRLLLYFNTNKPHSFFCRIPVVLENRRSSQGEGEGAHPLHPSPWSAPVLNDSIEFFSDYFRTLDDHKKGSSTSWIISRKCQSEQAQYSQHAQLSTPQTWAALSRRAKGNGKGSFYAESCHVPLRL